MLGQQQQHWIVLAVASGACAAFNGVFAKLTTTEMTSTVAGRLSISLGLAKENHLVDYGLRAVFFGCNLIFNGIVSYNPRRRLSLARSRTAAGCLVLE